MEKTVVNRLRLLPCAKDVCQKCAGKHEPHEPHNQQSLYYQYKFYAENNYRWPTWKDAMSHCDEQTKKLWTKALEARGISV